MHDFIHLHVLSYCVIEERQWVGWEKKKLGSKGRLTSYSVIFPMLLC